MPRAPRTPLAAFINHVLHNDQIGGDNLAVVISASERKLTLMRAGDGKVMGPLHRSELLPGGLQEAEV